ncbi:hypothetical protein ScPMuIL_003943 [Solemya velum]
MADKLKTLKERSQLRKQLLAQALGVNNPGGLKTVLKSREDIEDEEKSSKLPKSSVHMGSKSKSFFCLQKNLEGEEDDEFYTDSSTFLKGTQSANPHNDYCQNHVDTGERPQNFIRDVGLANRFEEYPKLRELIRLKDELISHTNAPPMYLKCDLRQFDLSELDSKFDVILIEPPLEEYQRTRGAVYDTYWSWDEIERLSIPSVAAQRSFLWIWCGNAEGLERGRQCLKTWGFRRCEDICWIMTNIKNPGHTKNLEPNSIFQRTKEHCLMGIKGTVKRSTDGDFIHANVDIDLIIDDEPQYGTKDKPIEMFHIVEHFCLGRRRLHLFGRDSTIRPGWLSLGTELSSSNYDHEVYSGFFNKEPGIVTGCTEEIERLRPKSPQPKSKQGNNFDRGGRGPSRGRAMRGHGGMDRGSGPMFRGGHLGRGMSGGRGDGRMLSRGRGFGRGGRGPFRPRGMNRPR